MIIRAGVEADVSRCIELSREFYRATEYPRHIPFCPDSVAEWLRYAMDQGLLFVADTGRKLVGFVVAVSSPFMMNRCFKVAAELAWYVTPECRRGSTGVRLLKALENAATQQGVRILSMMNLESVNPDKVDRLYRALGFVKTENTYMKVF